MMRVFMVKYRSRNLIKATAAVLLTPRGHDSRKDKFLMQFDHTPTPYFPDNLDDYAPWVATHGLLAPYGKCQCGCGEDAPISPCSSFGRGYRIGHPCRFMGKHGTFGPRPQSPPELLPLVPGATIAYIPLTQEKFAIVDPGDFEWLSQWKWYAYCAHGIWYAGRTRYAPNGSRLMGMHRFIMGMPADLQVDHIDGDGLNNTRANLRLATHMQNSQNKRLSSHNTSGYKGVSFHRDTGKWAAYIRANNKRIHLGLHVTADAAAEAYNRAARELHGEFARLNEIKGAAHD